MTEVERYYNDNVQYEWDRLSRRRTEFALTLRAFKEYLPAPPCRILDIGGGPGRYSIEHLPDTVPFGMTVGIIRIPIRGQTTK